MKTTNLKEKRKKLRNKKFQTLYEQIPFLRDKTYPERTWWIRYYKLRTTWKTNFPSLEFPPDDFHTLYMVKPWDEPDYLNGFLGVNHEVNCDLQDIEELFLFLGKGEIKGSYDWIHTRLESIEWPGVIECYFSDLEGCSDCRYRFKCELKV